MISIPINTERPKKLDLFTAIQNSDYHENVKDSLVLMFLEHFSNKNNRWFFFNKVSESASHNIIVIQHKMKVMIGGKYYDIPLLIYFKDSYPLSAPEIYIEKRGNFLDINPRLPNGFISKRTLRINYELYFKWNKEANSIIDVLNYLNKIFNKYFPIFTSKTQKYYDGPCELDIRRSAYIYLNVDEEDNKESISSNMISRTVSLNGNESNKTSCTSDESLKITPTPAPDFDMLRQYTPEGDNTEMMRNDSEIREDLIEQLTNKLRAKLIGRLKEQREIQNVLQNTKEVLEEKISNCDMLLCKQDSINKIVLELQNEIDNKDIDNILNSNYRNFDNNLLQMNPLQRGEACVQINNPKTLQRFVREKTLEELMNKSKIMLEKNIVPFVDIVKFIRVTSRDLFKYKEGQACYPFE